MNLIQLCIAFALVGVSFGAPAMVAQQPKPAEHAKAKKPEPVTGEMVSLNVGTKTLIVKTAPESEIKFTYSDTTEIVGVEKGAEGLSAKPGAIVTVTYDEHGTANIALKIEVKPKP